MSEMPAAARPIRRRVITEEVHEGPARASAYVCEAASCMSAQSHEITVRLGELVGEAGLGDVVVKRVGCLGLCAAGPRERGKSGQDDQRGCGRLHAQALRTRR